MIRRFLDWLDDVVFPCGEAIVAFMFMTLFLVILTAAAFGIVHDVLRDYGLVGSA